MHGYSWAHLEAKRHEGIDLLEGLEGVALLRTQLVRCPGSIQKDDCRSSALLQQILHLFYLSCPTTHTTLTHHTRFLITDSISVRHYAAVSLQQLIIMQTWKSCMQAETGLPPSQ